MNRPRMTKARRYILQRMQSAHLAWGYGEKGGREFFFTDGGHASGAVIEGMISCGLLEYKGGALGVGQEIVLGPTARGLSH